MRQDGKKLLIQINSHRAWLMWLASSGVNANSSNANFGPGDVNNGNVNSDNDLFNSNGNWNANGFAVRPVDSIHCGYAIINCIRDNIETNRCPVACKSYKCKNR